MYYFLHISLIPLCIQRFDNETVTKVTLSSILDDVFNSTATAVARLRQLVMSKMIYDELRFCMHVISELCQLSVCHSVLLSYSFTIFFSAILLFQIAIPDVVEAAKNADILVFVVPHQFIQRICSTLQGKIKSTAVGLSLIKVRFCMYYSVYISQSRFSGDKRCDLVIFSFSLNMKAG